MTAITSLLPETSTTDLLPTPNSTGFFTPKAVLLTCAVALVTFLGMKAYQATQVAVKQHIREKITDYIVIGFTRDEKLTPQELTLKAEAIAVRRRLITLLNEIGNESIPGISEKKKADLKKIINAVTLLSTALDIFAPTKTKEGPRPTGWDVFETKIKAEILERIQIKYSEDTSPEMKEKQLAQEVNLSEQINNIYVKALEKNKESSPLQKFLLEQAFSALKKTL